MNTFLRNLTPGQQAGLMFVFVFGLLMLLTAVAFGLCLKDRRQDDRRTQSLTEFNTALGISWLITTVIWVAWSLAEPVTAVWFGFVAFVALQAFITRSLTRQGDHRSLLLVFFVTLPMLFARVIHRNVDLVTMFVLRCMPLWRFRCLAC